MCLGRPKGVDTANPDGPITTLVMVYMAADNSLAGEVEADLAEMAQVCGEGKIRTVVQVDMPAGSRRMWLTYDRAGERFDVLQEMGPQNTGDPQVLLDFVRWAHERHPAPRNVLVLWNHGAGIKDTDPYRGVSVAMKRGILYDDGQRDFVTANELDSIMDGIVGILGQPLDVLGMDACLMSGIEVACEVAGDFSKPARARCMVASELVEPGRGWPYADVLYSIRSAPASDALDWGDQIVEVYTLTEKDGETLTLSALDLGNAERACGAIRALANELTTWIPAHRTTWGKVQSTVVRMDDADYVDILHLCHVLGGLDESLDDLCAWVIETILWTDPLIYRANPPKAGMCGVSILLPKSGVLPPGYRDTRFAKLTGWDRVVLS